MRVAAGQRLSFWRCLFASVLSAIVAPAIFMFIVSMAALSTGLTPHMTLRGAFMGSLLTPLLAPLVAPLGWSIALLGALFGGLALVFSGQTDRSSFALVGSAVGLVTGSLIPDFANASEWAPGGWFFPIVSIVTGAIVMQLWRAVILPGRQAA